MQAPTTFLAPWVRLCALWARVKATWGWRHKMKLLGSAMMGVSFAQANIGQLAHVLPEARMGMLLGLFGVASFVIGLLETICQMFLINDEEPPPSIPSTSTTSP